MRSARVRVFHHGSALHRSQLNPKCWAYRIDIALLPLETSWGPHAVRDAERPAPSRTLCKTKNMLSSAETAKIDVLGVKGSQVQILSARRRLEGGSVFSEEKSPGRLPLPCPVKWASRTGVGCPARFARAGARRIVRSRPNARTPPEALGQLQRCGGWPGGRGEPSTSEMSFVNVSDKIELASSPYFEDSSKGVRKRPMPAVRSGQWTKSRAARTMLSASMPWYLYTASKDPA
jgi:hypothetical protein